MHGKYSNVEIKTNEEKVKQKKNPKYIRYNKIK
jgi:hypothetical protein